LHYYRKWNRHGAKTHAEKFRNGVRPHAYSTIAEKGGRKDMGLGPMSKGLEIGLRPMPKPLGIGPRPMSKVLYASGGAPCLNVKQFFLKLKFSNFP